VESTWRSQACAANVKPAPDVIRRLNRDEYAATIRDLFDLQLDFREALPIDGPGGEGFDNAETLSFSAALEKYVETGSMVDAASKELKSRVKIFIARPDRISANSRLPQDSQAFLPKAFRSRSMRNG
jgi:hypothetical protein